MKRGDLLRHLRKHGCHLKREGRSHSLWTNPATGAIEAVRIVDESGEDYGYAAERFFAIEVPKPLQRALLKAAS